MNMKKTSAILLATTLSFAGASYAIAGNHGEMKGERGCKNDSSEMSQGKHHGKKKHKGMGFSQLDLSDQQKQEMRDIMRTTKSDNKANKSSKSEARTAHRAAMQTLISSESFNEQQAKALIEAQQLQKAEKQLSMLKAKHQMYQLLTEEQKVQYQALKEKRANR